MNVECVLDSNVLLYAASKATEDADKAAIARQLMRTVRFGVPLQVAQEFFHNARIKARLAISPEHCEKILTALLERAVIVTDIGIFSEARRLCLRYQIGYWDAAVVAACKGLGARILYTEDLSHGRSYDEVRVINPFAVSELQCPPAAP